MEESQAKYSEFLPLKYSLFATMIYDWEVRLASQLSFKREEY